MRAEFFQGLYEVMKKDDKVILFTSDTGAIVLDEVRKNIANRCINVGIAGMNMVSAAAGLALCGKIVYVYAIIPFITLRVFEHYRVDVCCTNLNVKAVGVGAGLDYSTLGPTHHAHEDIAVMRTLPGLTILSPCDEITGTAFAKLSYDTPGPVYVRLERYGKPLVYSKNDTDWSKGMNILKKGDGKVAIIATGKMVVNALKVAENLKKNSIDATVVDLYRIKPLNTEMMLDIINNSKHIVTYEEHTVVGGIGSMLSDLMIETRISKPLTKIGLPDDYCRRYGSREYLHGLIGIDAETATKKIKAEIGK